MHTHQSLKKQLNALIIALDNYIRPDFEEMTADQLETVDSILFMNLNSMQYYDTFDLGFLNIEIRIADFTKTMFEKIKGKILESNLEDIEKNPHVLILILDKLKEMQSLEIMDFFMIKVLVFCMKITVERIKNMKLSIKKSKRNRSNSPTMSLKDLYGIFSDDGDIKEYERGCTPKI